MYTLTINGNTPEELFANLETLLASKQGAIIPSAPPAQQFAPIMPPAPQPPIAANHPQPTAPAQPPVGMTAPPAAAPAMQNPAMQPPAATLPPQAPAPTYTLDALARAGATLAQSGKMNEALALLARYGIQTVNQLKPEQYGAFATELRALGAQV